MQLTYEFTDDSKLKKGGSVMLVRVGEALSCDSRVTTLGSLNLVLGVHG